MKSKAAAKKKTGTRVRLESANGTRRYREFRQRGRYLVTDMVYRWDGRLFTYDHFEPDQGSEELNTYVFRPARVRMVW